MTGELKKLKLEACDDSEYTPNGKSYEVLLNPEKIDETFKIEYDKTTIAGSAGADAKFNHIKPPIFHIDFLFDSTGIAQYNPGFGANFFAKDDKQSVVSQVEQFKDVTLYVKGETHQPHYVKITWGTLIIKARMVDLKITYTLFKPDGTPIRAKANATFVKAQKNIERIYQDDLSSPDLTHVRVVKQGDTLPGMTNKIYNDPSYYLEVARFNNLNDFRDLKPGTKIVFPPIEQS